MRGYIVRGLFLFSLDFYLGSGIRARRRMAVAHSRYADSIPINCRVQLIGRGLGLSSARFSNVDTAGHGVFIIYVGRFLGYQRHINPNLIFWLQLNPWRVFWMPNDRSCCGIAHQISPNC